MTKRPLVELSELDRTALTSLVTGGAMSVRVLKRARALLMLAEGRSARSVGDAVGLSKNTVLTIARRHRAEGLEGALRERPRPGAPRRLDPSQADALMALTSLPPPTGRRRWSVRLLAAEASRRGIVPSVGRETVRVLLRERTARS